MLPAVSRLRTSEEFRLVMRNGRRSGNRHVVVYSYDDGTHEADLLPKVGFVVGKTVGNSVMRHRIVRQLRHIVREILPQIDATHVVVRALPHANGTTGNILEQAVLSALSKAGALSERGKK